MSAPRIDVATFFDFMRIDFRRWSMLERLTTNPLVRLDGGSARRPARPLPPAARRDLGARRTGAYTHLLHAVSALNAADWPFVVQFVAVQSGDGTTSVSHGLARAAAVQRGRTVLLVDCRTEELPEDDPFLALPSMLGEFRRDGGIEAALAPAEGEPELLCARMFSLIDTPANVEPALLQALFDRLKEYFAVIVLDCGAAMPSAEVLGIGRYCDGTVLVLQNEHTSERLAVETRDTIEQLGGHVVGSVLNRRRDRLPPWIRRWL
jgi:hypothetical protein